jgi:hypothetical protein
MSLSLWAEVIWIYFAAGSTSRFSDRLFPPSISAWLTHRLFQMCGEFTSGRRIVIGCGLRFGGGVVGWTRRGSGSSRKTEDWLSAPGDGRKSMHDRIWTAWSAALACYFVWLDREVMGAREGVLTARGKAPSSEKRISILLSSRVLAFAMVSVGRG